MYTLKVKAESGYLTQMGREDKKGIKVVTITEQVISE